ncbi:MAG: hypothetical protein M3Y71_08535 [Actinomycetota bacterium]|nr:hypothetical protein [Actinomycetota bacterium]
MPERNRVTPLGEVVAVALRGAWTGNRGVIHGSAADADDPHRRTGHDIVRSHTTTAWIICALSYRDEVAPRWEPGRWTAIFFHDEAVALAAGHRPCARCRRPAFTAYRDAVRAGSGDPGLGAGQLDARLHAERRDRTTRRRRWHRAPWTDLPDGAFVLEGGTPRLVLGDEVVTWGRQGYAATAARPRSGWATVVTPPTSLVALRAGYPVQIGARPGRAGPSVPGA